MQKVAGERYVYKFVCEPEALYSMSGSINTERCHSSPFSVMNQFRHHSYLPSTPNSPYDLPPYAPNRMYYGAAQAHFAHSQCGGNCQSPSCGASPGYFQQMNLAHGPPPPHAMHPDQDSSPFITKSPSAGDPNQPYIHPPLSRTPHFRERLNGM